MGRGSVPLTRIPSTPQAALLLVGTADAATWPPGIHSTPVSASPSSNALPRVASEAMTAAAQQQQHLLQLSQLTPHPSHHHHPHHHHHHRSSLHALAAIKRDMQVRAGPCASRSYFSAYGT